MRIKRVECEQFAGLQDRELEFEKGLNIVLGANECGKSTMIDLIYQLLFKDVKLDGRSDDGFMDKYFPKKISGPQGDYIDGVLVFETDSGTFKLKKEWVKGVGSCKLTTPAGVSIKNTSEIKKILVSELQHRAGIYNEIVFPSQKRDQLAIESIMSALNKKSANLSETRLDLTSTLTQAALETGGVSLEKIEKLLKSALAELSGRWDFTADAPEDSPKRASYKNAWKNDAGLITKAYYEVDEIKSKQVEAENAERAIETVKAEIKNLLEKKKTAEKVRLDFQKYSGFLEQANLLSDAIEDLKIRINEHEEVRKQWPILSENLEKAKNLQLKRADAVIRDLYIKALPVESEYLSISEKLQSLIKVDPADLKQVKNLLSKKQREEGKLSGMNVSAKIQKLGKTPIDITNISTGELIPVNDTEISISEAIEISVPDIMTMQLVPNGIDAGSVKSEIDSISSEIAEIYKKYGVSNDDELQEMADSYEELEKKVERLKLNLEKILGEHSWDDLQKENEELTDNVESEDTVNNQIANLCGLKSIESYIGSLESTVSTYEGKYHSLENLSETIVNLQNTLEGNQIKLESVTDIPEEFQNITDVVGYKASLEQEIEDCETQLDQHDTKLRELEQNLGDKSAEEYSEELNVKAALLEAKKTEYTHWLNIYNTFCMIKEKTVGNPVEDIAENFNEYLSLITDGGVQLTSLDEKMLASLASENNSLTYEILSEGTKDTITLAFRLAMLEHLFPQGNGLAIFDDPFTDMDPTRVNNACKLIQKFAESNQVIFVTCDKKYVEYMNANIVMVEK